MSNNLFAKMDEVLKKAPENRHSYYQLKHFIIGKEPTVQAKMWQCLKELQTRKETIDNLIVEIADLHDDVALIDVEIEKENVTKSKTFKDKYTKELAVKEMDIRIRKLKRSADRINRNITKLGEKLEFSIQEARFFLQAFEALEKVEPLKDYDDHDAQKELWEARIAEEINLRILLKQGLTTDLVKTALTLPEDSVVKVEVEKMIQNFMSQKMIQNKEVNDTKQIIKRE